MNVHVVSCDRRFEQIAEFMHLRQAVASLPALSRSAGCAIFCYVTPRCDQPVLTQAELPRGCRFGFGYRDDCDDEGTEGIVCTP